MDQSNTIFSSGASDAGEHACAQLGGQYRGRAPFADDHGRPGICRTHCSFHVAPAARMTASTAATVSPAPGYVAHLHGMSSQVDRLTHPGYQRHAGFAARDQNSITADGFLRSAAADAISASVARVCRATCESSCQFGVTNVAPA